MKALLKKLAILGVLSILLSSFIGFGYIKIHLPKKNGEIKTPELHDKVTVYYDKHGRAHAFTENEHDLFFIQGYLTAQDRLFQIDLARRAARGKLSEVIGRYGLERDKYVRTIGLIDSTEKELKECDESTLKILNAYGQGVTAYINKNKNNLPLEFKALHYTPDPWEPADSISLYKQLAEITDTSWQIDLMRQEIYQTIPQDKADILFEQNFPANPVINYDKKRYLVYDDKILKKQVLMQKWQKVKEKAKFRDAMKSPYFKIREKVIQAADFLRNGSDRWEGFNSGSNCWVISSQHAPILANDPHLELVNPSFWYPIHLIDSSSNTDVTGLSIPGIPGILIGHNGKIAWGITSLSADVQDIFIGEFKNRHSLLYKEGNSWVKAKVVKSEINIRNEAKPYIHKTLITNAGPILDRNKNKGLALKWAIQDAIGYDSVKGLWKMNMASDWNEFRDGLRFYNGPTLSFHYIDKDGNIGYQAAGVIPYRVKGLGGLPIAGFKVDEHWMGLLPFDKLPNSYNPQTGYLVSANNKIVSPEYDYNLGNNFLSPFRAGRISTLLSTEKNLDLKKNQKIQKDEYSYVASFIIPQILEAYYSSKNKDKNLANIMQLLSKWDFKISANSPEAFIFEKTYENLLKKVVFSKLGEKLGKYYLKEWRANSLGIVKILMYEDPYWLPEGVKDYKTLLLLSLSDAVVDIKKITKSNNPSTWKWGKYHTLTFEHPFSKVFPPFSPFTNTGPIKVGGDRDTISAFGTNSNLKVVWGPSARVVINLKDPDHAYFQLPLGNSAEIGSPYYRDQTKGWLRNSDVPFVYNRWLIVKTAKRKMVLSPT
jgi:penicillin amidase